MYSHCAWKTNTHELVSLYVAESYYCYLQPDHVNIFPAKQSLRSNTCVLCIWIVNNVGLSLLQWKQDQMKKDVDKTACQANKITRYQHEAHISGHALAASPNKIYSKITTHSESPTEHSFPQNTKHTVPDRPRYTINIPSSSLNAPCASPHSLHISMTLFL